MLCLRYFELNVSVRTVSEKFEVFFQGANNNDGCRVHVLPALPFENATNINGVFCSVGSHLSQRRLKFIKGEKDTCESTVSEKHFIT